MKETKGRQRHQKVEGAETPNVPTSSSRDVHKRESAFLCGNGRMGIGPQRPMAIAIHDL